MPAEAGIQHVAKNWLPAFAGTSGTGHARRSYFLSTLAARFSKNALMRFFASSLPCAIAAVERLHHEAAGAVLLGDARQHVHDREIRHRRISGDAFRDLDPLREPLAFADQIMREAQRLPFLGAVGAAGQHQVDHARDADQPRQAHRAATAHENAARAFGQRVIGRALRDADVRRRRKLEPAADHRAMHHGDDRHASEFDLVEDAMPDA